MKHKQWTKDEIKKLITIWNSKTTPQLAKELGRSNTQISSMATQMRKSGFKLPKKHNKGYIRSLLSEVLKEIR